MSPLGSGLNFFTNAIDKTPGTTGAFVDVDCSADIPSGASGVILEVYNASGAKSIGAVRKNDSTDGQANHKVISAGHIYTLIGVDANRVFEAYIDSGVQVWLTGYTDQGTDFLLNKVNKNVTTTGSWVDVDASADIPSDANGVIVELWNSTGTSNLDAAARKNGSTDNFTPKQILNQCYIHALCGVDANRIFQAYIEGTNIKVSVIGYTKSPVVWKTNADDISLGTTSAWTDIDVTTQTASDADGVVIEALNTNTGTEYGGQVRKSGSTDARTANITLRRSGHIFMAIGVDTGQVLQGYITNVAVDFKLLGYAKPAGAVQKAIADTVVLSAASPGIGARFSLGQALALAEAAPGIASRLVIAQGLGMADALTGLKGYLTLPEGLDLVEAPTLKAFLALLESLALAETPLAKAGLALGEGLGLAEILGLKASLALTEGLALADAVSVALGAIHKAISDALALAEALPAGTPRAFLSLAESLALAETVLLKLFKATSDSLGLTEASTIRALVGLTQALGLAEAPPGVKAALTLPQALGLSEATALGARIPVT